MPSTDHAETLGGFGEFLGLLFSSFFRWWWATITGFASIASFLIVSEQGITLSRLQFGILILLNMTLLFLTAATVWQGWRLYKRQFARPAFLGIQRNNEYGASHVFLLGSSSVLSTGTLVELHRHHNGVECLVALLEIVERNTKRQYQAKPLWIAPVHQKDLRMNQVSVVDMTVYPLVSSRALAMLTPQVVNGANGDAT